MLSSVLRSKTATQVNIAIMCAFVKLRRMISSHKELARKLQELEKKIGRHEVEIQTIFKVIRELMATSQKPKRRIGFSP